MSSRTNEKAIFYKILVAIDSSDASMDAADYATAISQRYNAELHALHVIHADVDLYGPHETSEFTRNMRNEGEKYLNKVKVKANEKDIQIKTEIISSKSHLFKNHFSVCIDRLQDLPHLFLVSRRDVRCEPIQTQTRTIHYFRQHPHSCLS